jgi:hypothetical protein
MGVHYPLNDLNSIIFSRKMFHVFVPIASISDNVKARLHGTREIERFCTGRLWGVMGWEGPAAVEREATHMGCSDTLWSLHNCTGLLDG